MDSVTLMTKRNVLEVRITKDFVVSEEHFVCILISGIVVSDLPLAKFSVACNDHQII